MRRSAAYRAPTGKAHTSSKSELLTTPPYKLDFKPTTAKHDKPRQTGMRSTRKVCKHCLVLKNELRYTHFMAPGGSKAKDGATRDNRKETQAALPMFMVLNERTGSRQAQLAKSCRANTRSPANHTMSLRVVLAIKLLGSNGYGLAWPSRHARNTKQAQSPQTTHRTSHCRTAPLPRELTACTRW